MENRDNVKTLNVFIPLLFIYDGTPDSSNELLKYLFVNHGV